MTYCMSSGLHVTLWALGLGNQHKCAGPLAAALAVIKKPFISDPGISCLLPATLTLGQPNWLAGKCYPLVFDRSHLNMLHPHDQVYNIHEVNCYPLVKVNELCCICQYYEIANRKC